MVDHAATADSMIDHLSAQVNRDEKKMKKITHMGASNAAHQHALSMVGKVPTDQQELLGRVVLAGALENNAWWHHIHTFK